MADGKKRSIRFVDLVRTDRDRRVWGGDYVWPTQSGRQGSLCSHAVECVLLLVEDKRRQKGEFFLIHVTEDVLLPMTSRLWDPRLVIEEGWQVQGDHLITLSMMNALMGATIAFTGKKKNRSCPL